MDAFTTAYIAAAVWASLGPDDVPLDESDAELAPETREQMIAECRDFQTEHATMLEHAYQEPGYDAGQAGHDFWLTRNHHGAGYWDRGLEDVGEALSTYAQRRGERDLYIGDDGLIYQSP